MARRRTQVRAVSASVMFLPGLLLPVWGWQALGRPFAFGGHYAPTWHFAGLMSMVTAGFLTWPLIATAVLCLSLDALLGLLVPPPVRTWRRGRLLDRGIVRRQQRSSYIGKRLRRVVYAADRYQCASCRGRLGIEIAELQVDHFRPWRWGGRTTLWNCMAICGPCNRIKLDYWRERSGYAHFARRYAEGSMAQAAVVQHRLRWHRRNPLRWFRAAWAITG